MRRPSSRARRRELHADARACVEFETAMAAALRQQGRYSAERRLRRRDGSLRWVQVAARPVDPDDVEAGVICSYRRRRRAPPARESLQPRPSARAPSSTRCWWASSRWERRHRVDEPLGAPHVRRRAGRLRRRADQHRGHAEADHPLRRTDYPSAWPRARPRPSSAGCKAATGASSGSSATPSSPAGRVHDGRQLTFALLDIERRRQAESASRRPRPRCSA
jgi:hypothetical protein